MTPTLILQFISAALQALPIGLETAEEIATAIGNLSAQLQTFISEARDPNPSEWAALNTQLANGLSSLLNAKPAAPVATAGFSQTPIAQPSEAPAS